MDEKQITANLQPNSPWNLKKRPDTRIPRLRRRECRGRAGGVRKRDRRSRRGTRRASAGVPGYAPPVAVPPGVAPGRHRSGDPHALHHVRWHGRVPCVRKDTEGVKGKGKAAKAILYRFGGASLIKHMHKRYATLDANQEAWKKLGYIDERRDCMKYGEYRKQGLYIGSGLIESACRTDVARRCKQSGMHWRFKNAASMCALVARFRSNLHAA